MSPRITVAIDPQLAPYRPEIDWTLRTIFSIIGYAWTEVPPGTTADIAYIGTDVSHATARVALHADVRNWERRRQLRLAGVDRKGNLATLGFAGGTNGRQEPWRRTATQLLCPHDYVFDVFWAITGQEERHLSHDKHGFTDLTGTVGHREQFLLQATASGFAVWLQAQLIDLGHPPGVPRWPGGRAAAAAMSHDVDYPEVKRWLEPARILVRQGLGGLSNAVQVAAGRRHHWQFPSWIKFETTLGIRSAFYFVARCGSLLQYAMGRPDPFYDIASDRFRQLFRQLADAGVEIGLHSSYDVYDSFERFKAEKESLEHVSGQVVYGNRHHYLHLNPVDPEETLRLHERIGFRYDATLYHNAYVGFRRGLSHPFFPFHQADRSEIRTLQIPTAWMDDQLFGFRSHNPGEPRTLLRSLVDRVSQQGGCLLVNMHEYVLDERLFPDWLSTLTDLWRCVIERGDYWLATPREIADHWIARQSAILKCSAGLAS
ncbi:MAG TPA: polysaccharide deacetylase family protein [Vicinamibacterales bacterium]